MINMLRKGFAKVLFFHFKSKQIDRIRAEWNIQCGWACEMHVVENCKYARIIEISLVKTVSLAFCARLMTCGVKTFSSQMN